MSISNNNNGSVLFLGAVQGKRKTDNQPFYILEFAVPSTRDSVFGMETANVFTDVNTYNDFINHAKPNTFYGFIVHYSRGGWDLISYKF